MKKTKRQQNSMIINLVFNGSLLFIFIIVSWVYLYPNLTDISTKKESALTLSNELTMLEKSGPSFIEFSNLRRDMSSISDTFTQKLLAQVTNEFYSQNLQDSGSQNFLDYLEEKKNGLENDADILEQRDSNIETILPSYGDLGSDSGSAVTDFDFTSYLERIFDTFNLKYSGKIGIGELEPVGIIDSDQSSARQDLNASLYSTSLKLDVIGRKKDVVHFIHYFENVGNVYIDDNNELRVYNDSAISQLGKSVVVNGDSRTNNYNLYLHQLGDIDYIRFNTYIDSDLEFRKLEAQSLNDFIKQNQGEQKYEFEIGLTFYFKGLPKYKVTEFITEFLNSHKKAKTLVKKAILNISKKSSPSSEDRLYLGQLKSIDAWLLKTTQSVQALTKESKDPDKIESVYRQVIDLDNTLEQIMLLIESKQEINK